MLQECHKRTRIALCLRLPGGTLLSNPLSSSALVSYLQYHIEV